MPRLHFEDFAPGAVAAYEGIMIDERSILRFAREFDPQPFHLDAEAAKRTFVGGLIASGWHTCALTMRMIADSFIRTPPPWERPASRRSGGCGRSGQAMSCASA